MNKIGYKRIIGLFIFALTIMLLGIINVNADGICDETVTRMNNNDEALKRYAISMEYDKNLKKYIIKSKYDDSTTGAMLREYDKNFKGSSVKFKVDGLYFYTPMEDTEKEKNAIRNENATYVENVSSSISGFVSSGKISSLSLFANDDKGIRIDTSVTDVRKDDNKFGVAVKLVPDGFNDPELVSACKKDGKNPSFYVVVYTAFETGSQMPAKVITFNGEGVSGSTYKQVDCNNVNSYPENSFERNFCNDKIAAVGPNGTEKKGTTRKFTIKEYIKGNMIKYEDNKTNDNNVYKPGKALSFKCDYNDLVTGVPEDDNKYYTNKHYLYGEGTIKISLENGYRYTGEYSSKDVKLDASCELKCEEVVKVEYGPPVASSAGLCFEYKVKVTSRVNCEMVTPPNKPPEQVVCTPTPWCNHPGGYADHQGGPNELFDECVMSCDGGKYSDKCSNKCYKKVYGKSIVRRTTGDEIKYDDKLADIPYIFKYDSNDILIWDLGGDTRRYYSNGDTFDKSCPGKGQATSVPRDSYWHRNSSWGYPGSVYVRYDYTGIPLIQNCSTTHCWWEENDSDDCTDTSKARYLNDPSNYTNRPDGKDYKGQSSIEKDEKFNKEKYEELVKECSAYASCNTTTSEFTISVDYTDNGTNTKQTIYFPYTNKNDSNTKDTITNKNKSASCPTAKNSIILSSDGCYNCAETNEKRMYMTEWSFPGTWINLKDATISYNPDSATTTSWKKYPYKFCLPYNIADTNTRWYNYYQAKVHGDDQSFSYNDISYITNITCPDGTKVTNVCEYRNTQFTDSNEKDIDYNIHASTRKFGMFEWDIDISCFYAVNSEFPKLNREENCSKLTCKPAKTPEEDPVKIRSVDLENLFPDKEGNKLTDSSSTGRTPGFNWTSFAEQEKKDVDYKSSPSNYAKWIQAKGTSVYSDDYLDYEINLTKEAINEIKKEFNSGINKKYTNWEGDVEVNSVTNYLSPLFRNGGILSKNSHYPVGNAITCNNMKNYRSTECEDFSEEVK